MRRALLVSLCITIESLVCSYISYPVFAQTATVSNLTLDAAINQAEANNPQLLAAGRSIPLAQAGLTIAGAGLNPRLGIDIPFGQAETKHTVSIEKTFELGGKRQARIGLANAQIQQADLQLNLLRWQIRNQVRQAYAELGIAQGAQQLSQETLAINGQLVDIAKVRLNAGDVAQADVVQARFTFEQARQKQEPAANRVRQAAIRLNTLLNQPTNTVINLVDGAAFRFSLSAPKTALRPDQKLPDLSVLQQVAKASRLDLAVARQQIQLGNAQIRLARAARIPDVTLAAGFVWDPGLPSTPTPVTTAVILSARVDLPLFNNGQGTLNQARATISQSEAQLVALEAQIDGEVATAYENLASAQRLLLRDRTVLLPQAIEVLNLSRQSYQFGQTGLSDALLVQQSVQTVFDGFYTDILAYQTALGALEQAVNQPLSTINKNTNAPLTH